MAISLTVVFYNEYCSAKVVPHNSPLSAVLLYTDHQVAKINHHKKAPSSLIIPGREILEEVDQSSKQSIYGAEGVAHSRMDLIK